MRFVPIIFCFTLLTLVGGFMARSVYDEFIENELVGETKRYLNGQGHDDIDVRYTNHFISLTNLPEEKSQLARIANGVDRNVKGAYIEVPAIAPQLDIVRTLGRQFTLNGQVKDEATRVALGRLVQGSVDGAIVVNHIDHGQHVGDADWMLGCREFLPEFLNKPGFVRFRAGEKSFTLTADANNNSEREALIGSAEQNLGEFGLIDDRIATKILDPATLSVSSVDGTPGGFRVAGALPTAAAKANLMETLGDSFPGKTIVDQDLKVSRGVSSPWWLGNAEKLLVPFFYETGGKGSFAYTPEKFVIKGDVTDENVMDQFLAIGLSTKPTDYQVENELSIIPHVEPELIARVLGNGKVVMTGQIRDEKLKASVTNQLKDKYPAGVFSEQILVSPTVKENEWTSVGEFFATSLHQLKLARVELHRDSLVLKGEAVNVETSKSLVDLAAKVMGSEDRVINEIKIGAESEALTPPLTNGDGQTEAVLKSDLEAVNLTEAEESLATQLKSTAVYFGSGSSYINNDGKSKIRSMAEVIRESNSDRTLTVGGYADTQGDPEKNKALSLRRANAVKEELINLGVPAAKLDVQHFGEDVTNVADEQLWKSRRVELSLTE